MIKIISLFLENDFPFALSLGNLFKISPEICRIHVRELYYLWAEYIVDISWNKCLFIVIFSCFRGSDTFSIESIFHLDCPKKWCKHWKMWHTSHPVVYYTDLWIFVLIPAIFSCTFCWACIFCNKLLCCYVACRILFWVLSWIEFMNWIEYIEYNIE